MLFQYPSQFEEMANEKQKAVCLTAFDLLKTIYSNERDNMLDVNELKLRTVQDQDAVIEFITENIIGIHEQDAVILCHTLFLMQTLLKMYKPEDIKVVFSMFEDLVFMLLAKYNPEFSDE